MSRQNQFRHHQVSIAPNLESRSEAIFGTFDTRAKAPTMVAGSSLTLNPHGLPKVPKYHNFPVIIGHFGRGPRIVTHNYKLSVFDSQTKCSGTCENINFRRILQNIMIFAKKILAITEFPPPPPKNPDPRPLFAYLVAAKKFPPWLSTVSSHLVHMNHRKFIKKLENPTFLDKLRRS